MNKGIALGVEGQKLALDSAPEWREKCYAWFDCLPVKSIFTSNELTDACGLPAFLGSRNAIGGVFGALSRAGRIVRTGDVRLATRESRHGSRVPVWRKVS